MGVTETATSYSFRQVNPFRGSLQVINQPYCRALSADGKHWQIQVSCEVHQQEWGIQDTPIARRYVVAGSWQADTGYSSMPLEPMLDTPDESLIPTQLIPALEHIHTQLPLRQKDRYECWGLDRDGQPLVLLKTSLQAPAHAAGTETPGWRASTPLLEELPAEQLRPLQAAVNQALTGIRWFQRLPDGSGQEPHQPDQRLPAAAFPTLLIRESWEDHQLTRLARDYHEQLAPWLLLWQTLDDATRDRLESAACRQALAAARLLSLYPKTCNNKAINHIQVEARLRRGG